MLAGRIDDENYQKNFECIEYLRADRPAEYNFTILEMVPIQWEAHLLKLREQLGIDKVSSLTTCIVYAEDMSEFWCGQDFAQHACTITKFKLLDFPEDSPDPEVCRENVGLAEG